MNIPYLLPGRSNPPEEARNYPLISLPYASPYKVMHHNRNGSIKIENDPNKIDKVKIRQVNQYFSNE